MKSADMLTTSKVAERYEGSEKGRKDRQNDPIRFVEKPPRYFNLRLRSLDPWDLALFLNLLNNISAAFP